MKAKKVSYDQKNREDISNPYNKYSHADLLKMANIKQFDKCEIIRLDNGRIKVKPKSDN